MVVNNSEAAANIVLQKWASDLTLRGFAFVSAQIFLKSLSRTDYTDNTDLHRLIMIS